MGVVFLMGKGIYKFDLKDLYDKNSKGIPMTKEEKKEFNERRKKIKSQVERYNNPELKSEFIQR